MLVVEIIGILVVGYLLVSRFGTLEDGADGSLPLSSAPLFHYDWERDGC